MSEYDRIYIGAGIAAHLDALNASHGQKILFLDKEDRHTKRHSLCFWKTRPVIPADCIAQEWSQLKVSNGKKQTVNVHASSSYVLVWSDIYINYLKQEIEKRHSAEWLFETQVQAICGNIIQTPKGDYRSTKHIDSRLNMSFFEKDGIKQQFEEFIIETTADCFDPKEVTLMDFYSFNPLGFIYLLPLSKTKAVITPTYFSSHKIPNETYIKDLTNYLENRLSINSQNYKVLSSTQGCLPMSFCKHTNQRIGVAGGCARPSTGYSFYQQLKRQSKYHLCDQFLDRLFLKIMKRSPEKFPEIFFKLFSSPRIDSVIRFLQGDASWKDRLYVIQAIPKTPFLGF